MADTRIGTHLSLLPADGKSSAGLDRAAALREYRRRRANVERALSALDDFVSEMADAMSTPAPLRPTLSVTEAADYLGVSRSTMQRLIRDGKIPVLRLNSLPKIRRDDLVEFIRRNG